MCEKELQKEITVILDPHKEAFWARTKQKAYMMLQSAKPDLKQYISNWFCYLKLYLAINGCKNTYAQNVNT
jgi:hypothetical protein